MQLRDGSGPNGREVAFSEDTDLIFQVDPDLMKITMRFERAGRALYFHSYGTSRNHHLVYEGPRLGAEQVDIICRRYMQMICMLSGTLCPNMETQHRQGQDLLITFRLVPTVLSH